MCYHYSLKATKRELEKRFPNEKAGNGIDFLSTTHVTAFDEQPMPIVNESGIQLYNWSLVPHWTQIKENTYSNFFRR